MLSVTSWCSLSFWRLDCGRSFFWVGFLFRSFLVFLFSGFGSVMQFWLPCILMLFSLSPSARSPLNFFFCFFLVWRTGFLDLSCIILIHWTYHYNLSQLKKIAISLWFRWVCTDSVNCSSLDFQRVRWDKEERKKVIRNEKLNNFLNSSSIFHKVTNINWVFVYFSIGCLFGKSLFS